MASRPLHPDRRRAAGGCPGAAASASSPASSAAAVEGRLAAGDVVDAGANTGVLSCFLATLDPRRAVVIRPSPPTCEPIAANVRHLRERYADVANLRQCDAVLAAESGGVVTTLSRRAPPRRFP